MSTMTQTKKNRMIMREKFYMDKKISGYKPAEERRVYEFKHPLFGHTISILVSEGQIINHYKYEKRANKRQR